jgi:hypothetical protein
LESTFSVVKYKIVANEYTTSDTVTSKPQVDLEKSNVEAVFKKFFKLSCWITTEQQENFLKIKRPQHNG